MTNETWYSADRTVVKYVIEQGIFSKTPTECSKCEVVIENIRGASIDDLKKKFFSEILDGTREKTLIIGEGNSEIDKQIERAIQMMMINEKSIVEILLPSLLKSGNNEVAIKFDITLKNYEVYKPIWEWTPNEKYEIALKYKEIGVQLYKHTRYVDAFHRFSKACKILITLEPIPDLELEDELEKKINDLRLVLYNNMAGCQLEMRNYEHTISLCSKIIEKDKNNVKALYRRGVAHGNLKDVEKAVADLKNAITLEPHNHTAKEQFHIYNHKLQEANERSKNMVRRMFKT